jgi:cyclophilin family peptidyl-prolyl cis-trans isomerase
LSTLLTKSSKFKSFLSSYFIGFKHGKSDFKYFIIKNNYLEQWNKSKLNDNDFSSIYFEGFKFNQLISDISFLKIDSKYTFEDRYELMFSTSKSIYNVITVDFENDFTNKSEDTISNLVLSFFNYKNHESNSNLFILVNKDVVLSNQYQNFRKEFTHILHSLVQIGNEFMLCFIHNSMDKVFISTEHNDDPKRLKLNYSNPKNFLSKNEDFYKSWIDTSNLSVNNNENKLDKILKITTQTLTNTDEIKADMKSMMSEVGKIKSLTEDTNESIDNSISLILESVEKNYDLNDIDKYIDKVTQWFNYWDKIEDNTKTCMPGSELWGPNIK